MNTTTLIHNPVHDYRDAMHQAAFAYLLRRRDQFLSGDAQVLECCKQYLADSLEVPAHLVQRLAERAVAEFERATTQCVVLVEVNPTSQIGNPHFLLLDTLTQQRRSVPANALPPNLLQRHALSD
ncbi:hypothetical protein [Pseudomonas cremoricolorata]|uniref:hypothetical protein n=1 Tax=Pseudomonas cremoricolorata TaxID=157783 RepID=UPI00040E7EDD|nr:hypothetical protein [Pseudomonas cremoricolorata]